MRDSKESLPSDALFGKISLLSDGKESLQELLLSLN